MYRFQLGCRKKVSILIVKVEVQLRYNFVGVIKQVLRCGRIVTNVEISVVYSTYRLACSLTCFQSSFYIKHRVCGAKKGRLYSASMTGNHTLHVTLCRNSLEQLLLYDFVFSYSRSVFLNRFPLLAPQECLFRHFFFLFAYHLPS